jgi:hypothetical protein
VHLLTISFTTGLDSTYDEYIFKFINIHPATDGAEFQFNHEILMEQVLIIMLTKTSNFFSTNHKEDDTTGLSYSAPGG